MSSDSIQTDAPADPPADPPPPRALVDGSNVAHSTEGERASLGNILLVQAELRAEGYEPIVVADTALRHQIDDPAGYERLVADGVIHQAPAGTDADYFLLSFATELDASLVSNDRFRDRSRQFAARRAPRRSTPSRAIPCLAGGRRSTERRPRHRQHRQPASGAASSSNANVVPTPSVDCTSSSLPMAPRSFWQIASPSPALEKA